VRVRPFIKYYSLSVVTILSNLTGFSLKRMLFFSDNLLMEDLLLDCICFKDPVPFPQRYHFNQQTLMLRLHKRSVIDQLK